MFRSASLLLLFTGVQLTFCETEILQFWKCKDSDTQRWTKTDDNLHTRLDHGCAGGECQSETAFAVRGSAVVDTTTRLCADCSPYVEKREWRLEMRECTNSKSQQWLLSGNKMHCAAVGSDMCLDVGATPTCADKPFSTFPYCNPDLTFIDRAKDIVSRLTVDQKISQLGNGAAGVQSDNVSINAYQWWSEALHGVAGSPGVHFGGNLSHATSFPQVNTLGATFNKTLWHTMGSYIATECRAFANQGQAGLTYFAPNINVYRDPRWGRGQETPGEDPYLTANYAEAFVSGMQSGEDARYFKVITTCKHYDAYDLENWNKTDRHHFNAVVSAQDLVETYLPAFESCVRRAHGASIMCSYNAVNGVPSCANDFLQNKIVRDEWGFNGYIVSDCGAINDIMSSHHYTDTPEATVAAGLKGGCDLDCGGFYQKNGKAAIDKKTISEADLDLAVMRLFEHRIRLGEFDPPDEQPYRKIGTDAVATDNHNQLALDAARQGIVLLKNENGTLPLSKTVKVALIGPNADATGTMQGNYHGTAPFLISPMMGIQKLGVNVTYQQGCDVKCSSTSGFDAAVNAAKESDVVILVLGSDNSIASEGHDRTTLVLPGNQEKLLEEVKAASKGPLIVVLMSGGPYDISYAKTNAQGILWVGYPGQAGGQAIAEVLFGDYNPGGRLPVTFYPADYVNQISFFDMGMRSPPGRTYKFYTGMPIYWFGDGMSYTTFSYKWQDKLVSSIDMSIDEMMADGVPPYNVTVTNTGKMMGDDVVLAFVNSTAPGAPQRELIGFERVTLAPGKSQNVFFAVSATTFSIVNSDGRRVIHPASYSITVGDLVHTVNLKGETTILAEHPFKKW